jgi:methyltransferase (TIGR00027 family)
LRDDQPSTTARIAAFARAHHACYDRPVILDDHLAPAWFTDEERTMFSQNLAQAAQFFLPGETFATPAAARAAVLREQSIPINVARARYAEDTLLAATGARYIILGAGLDTFAFRRAPLDVDVIEVDHPATQRWKRARIAQLGWSIPARLAFLESDLSRETLALPAAPSVIAWLGVSYYLSRDAICRTLDSLASLATAGSMLVLDYLDDAAFDPARCAPSIARMQEAVRRTGEPMQSGFAPDDLARLLGEHGWRVEEDLGADAIAARYFAGRTDGLAPMPHFRLVRATR